jgi:hypothetical protein
MGAGRRRAARQDGAHDEEHEERGHLVDEALMVDAVHDVLLGCRDWSADIQGACSSAIRRVA